MNNPDQVMVDNATSQLAAQGRTMGASRDPRAKGNGRNGALTRRLAMIRGNGNASSKPN